MEKNNEFKPYIPASKVTPEFTVTSIVMGIILAVIFGAANAYLGLRVGMTVSASIPAAVIAMGVIRVIMRKTLFSKVILYRLWALRANQWRQAQSLRFLHCSCGQQRALWKSPVLLR